MTLITEPSICIPRVSCDITKQYIKTIFEQIFGINSIERIDLVKKTYSNYKSYYTAFVHFNYWNDSSNVQAIRNRIMNNQTFKIVYNEPWFWKCSTSRSIKPEFYTPYTHTKIIKRYDTNNNYLDTYNEVFQEINNILNEQVNHTPPPVTPNNSMDNIKLTPPPITRQYPINCPNLELI